MSTLIVIPTPLEFATFIDGCNVLNLALEEKQIGRMGCKYSDKQDITIACGGLGKVQFAVSTQHLVDAGPNWDLVICAGAAGGLSSLLAVGDIVIGPETVEYDIRNHFGPPLLPKFAASESTLRHYQEQVANTSWDFNVHFGVIASGDQDVVDEEVQRVIIERTGAVAVAWEGAGGAKACKFSDVPFVEIRGISDVADSSAPSDFVENLPCVMSNLAEFLML